MQTRDNTIAVIGAGISGVTTAYNLVKRGMAVTLFDREHYPAMETSFANGGQLSVSNAEVWNSWSTVMKGIKWMFSPGAPLLVHPAPTWHKLSWMAEFIASIPHYERNTLTTARLAIEARAQLKAIAAAENIAYDAVERGILHFYKTRREFESAGRTSALLAHAGLERRPVTPEEIRSIEPALRGTMYGGFYTESDFTGDIHKFTNGLAAACERLGVTMRMSTNVLAIDPGENGVTLTAQTKDPDGPKPPVEEWFGQIVVCGGVMSRDLAEQAGDRVNVYPVKGYSITVNLLDEKDRATAPWVSVLDDATKIVASRLGADRFRVAGTAEFSGYDLDIRAARIEPLVEWCRRHFPGMSTRQSVPWAGLRPMMPDMLPRVMRGQNPRVLYNTGHGHLGWTLSAATADAVGALAAARANTI